MVRLARNSFFFQNLWKKLEEKTATVDPFSGEKMLYFTEYQKFVDELEGDKNLRSLR